MSDEQQDLANQVKQLEAIVRHLEGGVAKRDERIAELTSAKNRQAAALKEAVQAKRRAELTTAAVVLQADPEFDHTAKPDAKRKEAAIAVAPETLKHLNPDTTVVIGEDGVTASVRKA